MGTLEIKNVSYRYGRGTPFETLALSDVSFSLETGEMICVIGHTGSGKSTLMQLMNALLKPDRGSVVLNGRDINKNKASAYEARFHVGLCFQYPEYQLFGETCSEDIAFGPRNMGLEQSEIQRRIQEAAALAGLEQNLLQSSPFALSGGQKRRCAIAGVLAMRPEFLILDEPTAGLDPAGREMLMETVRSYRLKTGAAVILVTHSMELAATSDRILVLGGGKLLLDGPPEAVFSEIDVLTKHGLNIPFASRVCRALQKRGFDLPTVCTPETAADAIESLLRGEGKL